jgi:hypothetical protein
LGAVITAGLLAAAIALEQACCIPCAAPTGFSNDEGAEQNNLMQFKLMFPGVGVRPKRHPGLINATSWRLLVWGAGAGGPVVASGCSQMQNLIVGVCAASLQIQDGFG